MKSGGGRRTRESAAAEWRPAHAGARRTIHGIGMGGVKAGQSEICYLPTVRSSTSKSKVAFGGITGAKPGAP